MPVLTSIHHQKIKKMTIDQVEDDKEYSRFQTDLTKGDEQSLGREEGELRRLNHLLDQTGSRLSHLGYQNVIHDIGLGRYDESRQGHDHISRWLVGRLCVLQRLDWLNAVCTVLVPESQGENVDTIRRDRMRLYWALRNMDCVEIAHECARSGNVNIVAALLQVYPYSLMPSIIEILHSIFEIAAVDQVEKVLGMLMEMQQGESNGEPAIQREADIVERDESIVLLRRQGDVAWYRCTERIAKICHGWCVPSAAQIESWIVQH